MENTNGAAAPKPAFHAFQWHITHRCNLRCAHCYQDDYKAEANRRTLVDTLDKYVRFLKNNNLYGHIYLTGGEPLCHDSFFFLVDEIGKREIALSILTNGTMIGREEARRLSASCLDYVQISLDGTERVHDAVRGKGAFARAIEGIDRLKEEEVCVLVSFTAQKNNYRSFAKLAKICEEHGVDKLWWDRVVTETPEDAERLALTTAQFKKEVVTAGKLNRKYKKASGRGLVSCERSLQFLGCPEGARGYKCRAGGNMLTVLADGAVMACRRLPFVIGNVADGEFDDIIANSDIMKKLKEAPLPEACRGCGHADRCGGGAKCVTYGQTGSFYTKDVNCFI